MASNWTWRRKLGAGLTAGGIAFAGVGGLANPSAAGLSVGDDPNITVTPISSLGHCNGIEPNGEGNTAKRLTGGELHPGGTADFEITYPNDDATSGRDTWVIEDCVKIGDQWLEGWRIEGPANTDPVFTLSISLDIPNDPTLIGQSYCNYAKTTAAPSDKQSSHRKAGPACFVISDIPTTTTSTSTTSTSSTTTSSTSSTSTSTSSTSTTSTSTSTTSSTTSTSIPTTTTTMAPTTTTTTMAPTTTTTAVIDAGPTVPDAPTTTTTAAPVVLPTDEEATTTTTGAPPVVEAGAVERPAPNQPATDEGSPAPDAPRVEVLGQELARTGAGSSTLLVLGGFVLVLGGLALTFGEPQVARRRI